MNLEDIYKLYRQFPVVTTDSRNCPQGSMFFALKGPSFDGNRYAAAALQGGCSYAVVDEEEYAVSDRTILVPDVLECLQALANLHRRRMHIPVVQITGTNGKTTTKELVSAVLSRKYNTLFTQGNLNNHIGVPLTILRITPEHEMAVIETGANHPGEIQFLSDIVEADAGLITNVGRAHLEGFGSFEGVKRTKGELYDHLHSSHGIIFINAFDDDLLHMAGEYGFSLGNDALPYVEGRVEECNPFLKIQWREDDEQPWHSVQTHLVGAYNIANLRAAVTVGLHYGVSSSDIDEALANYVPSNNRSEFRDTGRNHLIVDAYNANPTSMAAALTNFSFISSPKKMVILGDMRELGAESQTEHSRVLAQLSTSDVQAVWLVGEEFARASEASTIAARIFNNVEEVKAALSENSIEGYTILIKGSNGTKLYQLPEQL